MNKQKNLRATKKASRATTPVERLLLFLNAEATDASAVSDEEADAEIKRDGVDPQKLARKIKNSIVEALASSDMGESDSLSPYEAAREATPTQISVHDEATRWTGEFKESLISDDGVINDSVLPEQYLVESSVIYGNFDSGRWDTSGVYVSGTKAPAIVAVLPFLTEDAITNTGDASLYLADPIISKLSVLPQIIVRPTNTTSMYRHIPQYMECAPPEQMADYILAGSVRREGERVYATAQLMNVQEKTLWETKVDRRWGDILSLEDAISTQVVERLNLRLTPDEWQRLMKRHTENPEAYEKYKMGRFYWNQFTDQSLHMAITFFEQAIEIDRKYAKAFAGIADCYTWRGVLNMYPPQKTFKEARKWAARALELDDTLAEAHASLAYTHLCYGWDWQAAESGFKHAIELNCHYAMAHQGYAHLLTVLGRFDEALTEAEIALRVDPHSLIINVVKGVILYEARRYDESLEQFLRTIPLNKKFAATHYGLALVYGKKEEFHEACHSARKAYRLSDYDPVKKTVQAYMYAMSGAVDKAQQKLHELNELRMRESSYVPPFHMALIYSALDKVDEAFECLEEAFKDRDQWLVFLKVEPRLDALRGYQHFQELLLRLNFG